MNDAGALEATAGTSPGHLGNNPMNGRSLEVTLHQQDEPHASLPRGMEGVRVLIADLLARITDGDDAALTHAIFGDDFDCRKEWKP